MNSYRKKTCLLAQENETPCAASWSSMIEKNDVSRGQDFVPKQIVDLPET